MSEEIRPPEGYQDRGYLSPIGMSNFDQSIETGTEETLRAEKIYCHHAARDFNGDVWYQDGVFHESVYRYHAFQEHYTAPTLRELMNMVNDNHGWS